MIGELVASSDQWLNNSAKQSKVMTSNLDVFVADVLLLWGEMYHENWRNRGSNICTL